MAKVWIEAALNGAWTRERQPAIPIFRVGLEDRPWGVRETNVALVEEAVRLVRAAGGEPATAAEVRAACAKTDVALRRGSAYLSPA